VLAQGNPPLASLEIPVPFRSVAARSRCAVVAHARTAAASCLLAALTGCETDMDVLCAVNMRAAERALGQAQSSLARSHYEVARRACPDANLRTFARQLDQVERASAPLEGASNNQRQRSPEELLGARALEAERLGSIVMWTARVCRSPKKAAGEPACHRGGDADAGWCDALSRQGLAVRYRERQPEAFRWTATFPPSVGLDCALFGVAVQLDHWTDSSGSPSIERSHCRLGRGPFDDLELLVDHGASFHRFSLFSHEFAKQHPVHKAMLDHSAQRAAP